MKNLTAFTGRLTYEGVLKDQRPGLARVHGDIETTATAIFATMPNEGQERTAALTHLLDCWIALRDGYVAIQHAAAPPSKTQAGGGK